MITLPPNRNKIRQQWRRMPPFFRDMRCAAGLSIVALAERAGCSEGCVKAMERGKKVHREIALAVIEAVIERRTE
jgi:DNA-binding transcriptional regulator YiaG